jgi:hypothetical protein
MLWLLEGFVVPGMPNSLVEAILRAPCLRFLPFSRHLTDRSGGRTLTTCQIALLRGSFLSVSLTLGTAPRLGSCLRFQMRVQ